MSSHVHAFGVDFLRAVCFGWQRFCKIYWRGEQRASRSGQEKLSRLHARLANLGALAHAQGRPPLNPQASGPPALCGRTADPASVESKTASLWTRAFYAKRKGNRQLRLTLSRSQGVLQRHVVIFLARPSAKRRRDVAFDLPELKAERISPHEIEALVEQSLAEASALVSQDTSKPDSLPCGVPRHSPRHLPRPAGTVPRGVKEVRTGTIMGFGFESRKFGSRPAFDDYFVDIDCDGIIERIWGSALQDEVSRTQVGTGDRVSVRYLGRRPVEVIEQGVPVERMKKLFMIEKAAAD